MNKYSGEKAVLDVPREMAINYTIKNYHSTRVTLRQTLLDFLNKSIVNENILKKKEEKIANLMEFYRLSDDEFLKRMQAERAKYYSEQIK